MKDRCPPRRDVICRSESYGQEMSRAETKPDSNAAGASARREYERRAQARRDHVRKRYGPLGSLVAALAGEPQNIHAWQQGAEGEAATAQVLDLRLRRTSVIVIHDRRIPGHGRANIDHIAIGPGGVTVIDTKSSRGQVQLSTTGIVNRREQLLINGRDRTSQLDAVERQVKQVAAVLDRHGHENVPVVGALCFPFMRRSLFHYSRAREGRISVDDPVHIAKLAARPGKLDTQQVDGISALLATALPAASAEQ